MRIKFFHIVLLVLFCFCCNKLSGQADSTVIPLYAIDERKIIETKWRYTYALHLQSNTILHKADEEYDYYLNFKFDYTYEQYLNGDMTKGNWSMNEDELFYSFRHIKKWKVVEINKSTLVLEFKQANAKGSFQYHFVRVTSEEAPFIKPANELPDVNVDAEDPGKWFSLRKKKNKKKRNRKRDREPEEKPIYINIELIGGGYYGGIDPVLRDYIQIKSSGRLIKEFKSVANGLIVTKKDIPREELEQFAEFIIAQKYFEMERIYDCTSAICQKRKQEKPTPIPLRLSVAYGQRKKVITVPIWGKDESNAQYIDYPVSLDNIIDAIQRMAHRRE